MSSFPLPRLYPLDLLGYVSILCGHKKEYIPSWDLFFFFREEFLKHDWGNTHNNSEKAYPHILIKSLNVHMT